MNRPMMAAAVLSAATIGLHVIGGGQEVHAPIQASQMAVELRAISAVLWHFVSLILTLQSAGFLVLARAANRPLAGFLVALQFGTAALFLFYGMTMLGSVLIMPQWTIFAVLGGLGLWGMKKGAP